MATGHRDVPLPEELYQRVEVFVQGSEFKSVPDFVAFVLREVLEEHSSEEAFSPEEEEQVKQRLRALGYLD